MKITLHLYKSVKGVTLLGLILIIAVILLVVGIIYIVAWLADTMLGQADDGTAPASLVVTPPKATIIYKGTSHDELEKAIDRHIKSVGGVPEKSPKWDVKHSTNAIDWQVIKIIDPNTMPQGTYFEVSPREMMEEFPYLRDTPRGFFKVEPQKD